MRFSGVVFSCVLGVSALSSFALDRNAFTFTKYNLTVRIEPEQQRLGARGSITLRNDSDTEQKNAVLQISSSLDWRSIRVAGKPVQFVSQVYTSDVDHTGALSEAIVTLPREIPPNGTVDIELGYEGVIPLDATRLTRIGVPAEKARHSDWDQVSPSFTGLRGVGYVTWYPVAMEAASLSDGDFVFIEIGKWKAREQSSSMDVNLCVTNDGNSPVVLMNESQRPNGRTIKGDHDARETCSDHKFDPLGTSVPSVAVAEYSKVEASPISLHYLPDRRDEAETWKEACDDVRQFVSDLLGTPKAAMNIAEVPDSSAAPFESGTLLFTPFEAREHKLAQIVLVHQLTHSAFFSSRPWVYEGVAHFAQALWLEQQAGRQAALDYMGLHRTALADAEKAVGGLKESAASQSLILTTLEEYCRSKAMFVWWMLRDMVGESTLREALLSYRSEADKEPSYVQKLIESKSHRDLEWFFDDWVYRDRGLPDFRVASVYPRQLLKGAYLVSVSIENLGTAGAEVPVVVRIEGGEITKRLEVRGKSTAVVRIETPSPPQKVIVNDGSVPESELSNNQFKIEATGH